MMKDELCFYDDIESLFQEPSIGHEPNNWRLFIESSYRTRICVLVHNRNQYASMPIGHSVYIKEIYENVKFCLEPLDYNRHNWQFCGDLKVISFLKGPEGYTKHSCRPCLWDSRGTSQHNYRIH